MIGRRIFTSGMAGLATALALWQRPALASPRLRGVVGAAAVFAALHCFGAHPPPEDARTFEVVAQLGTVVNEPGAFDGYTLFSKYEEAYLIDNAGQLRHKWDLSSGAPQVRLTPNGNLLVRYNNRVFELDAAGDEIWRMTVTPGTVLHHDYLRLPNGNILLLLRSFKDKPELIAAGADPRFAPERISYAHLAEVAPTPPEGAEVVWEWSPWDHLIQDHDPSKPNFGVVGDHPERIDLNYPLAELATARERLSHMRIGRRLDRNWMHANAIDYHQELDLVMISVRHFSELWVVDHGTTTAEAEGRSGGRRGRGGDLLYRWGNPRAYRRGTAADQRLFWQHHTHWIKSGPGAGNILVFNNGWEFPGFERDHSSVVEVAWGGLGGLRGPSPGRAWGPAEPFWEYTASPPSEFLSYRMGGAQRLPNGNTLICVSEEGALVEVTPDGETVWKYVIPVAREILRQGDPIEIADRNVHVESGKPWAMGSRAETWVYRATRYAPDYPGLRGLDLTPKGPLEETPRKEQAQEETKTAATVPGD